MKFVNAQRKSKGIFWLLFKILWLSCRYKMGKGTIKLMLALYM